MFHISLCSATVFCGTSLGVASISLGKSSAFKKDEVTSIKLATRLEPAAVQQMLTRMFAIGQDVSWDHLQVSVGMFLRASGAGALHPATGSVIGNLGCTPFALRITKEVINMSSGRRCMVRT